MSREIVIQLGPHALARAKRAVLLGALRVANGNVTDAARLLRIHRQSMQRMLKGANEPDKRRRKR